MHYSKRKNIENSFKRVTLIQVLFLILAVCIILRLFQLQILNHKHYETLASQRHTITRELKPRRGEVFVLSNEKQGPEVKLTPIASNQQLYLLYGVPALIENATATIAQIEKVLPMSDEERWSTFLRLDKNDPYEPIQHNITQTQKEKLEKLNIDGIGFEDETKRLYPQNNLFSDVLGFVGYKDDLRVGQYGIEEYFEQDLAGEQGKIRMEKDPQGRMITFGQTEFEPVNDGSDLILTLDATVQFKICEILEKWREKMLAEDATAIVLNPQDGHILAMCDKPDFDLNNYSQVEGIDIYFNSAVNTAYEPGSVFKPFIMAAALDLEKVNPDTEFIDEGYLKFGPDIIHNAANKTYGKVTATQGLENSINTVLAKIGLGVGYKNLKSYLESFGFGKKTKITLPAESSGDISSLNQKGEIYTATASYGQGIMATPLQLAMAFGAIANDGILMLPQIILEKWNPDGKIEKFESQQIGRVISSKTANILKAMLVSVIKNGQGYRAGVDGYYIAGKTGTASIANPQGGYLNNQTNHTFAGFAPVDQPKFVILVKLSKPKNVPFASDSTAPAFAEMAKFLLQYYQIPPDY